MDIDTGAQQDSCYHVARFNEKGVFEVWWGGRCPNTITLGCLETEKTLHLCERVIIIIIIIIIMSSIRMEKCCLGFCWVAPPFPSFAFCVFWRKKRLKREEPL
jgi:hypothetical protein